jgi:hypothetical protein
VSGRTGASGKFDPELAKGSMKLFLSIEGNIELEFPRAKFGGVARDVGLMLLDSIPGLGGIANVVVFRRGYRFEESDRTRVRSNIRTLSPLPVNYSTGQFLQTFFEPQEKALSRDPHRERIRTQLALLPFETLQAAIFLASSGVRCACGRQAKWRLQNARPEPDFR